MKILTGALFTFIFFTYYFDGPFVNFHSKEEKGIRILKLELV